MKSSNIDLEYKSLVELIMRDGETTDTRNATVKRSFYPFVFRCSEAPLVGWRKMNHHLGIREMEWFLNSRGIVSEADPAVQRWWKPFAKEVTFILGGLVHKYYRVPMSYGAQYRRFYGLYGDELDQIQWLIDGIKREPNSRRHVITAWNTTDMDQLISERGLTNCHSTVCQFYVSNDRKLHYKTYQRSADVMLGLPYNLIQHWALLEYVAYMTELGVGSMSYILGDAHIYKSHWEAAEKLINSELPKNEGKLVYVPSSDNFLASDFIISGDIEFPILDKLTMEV